MKIKITYNDFSKRYIDQTMTLKNIVDRFTFPGWEQLFKEQESTIEFISSVLQEKCQDFFPLKMDIFRIFSCKPEDIKVVIIGQDPYHSISEGIPTAVGLSFSCSSGVNPSLRGIYKEIKEEFPEYTIPYTGDLTHWFNQGVFLMNVALTVEPGKPGTHLVLWKPFTDAVIEFIKSKCPNCIYLLWGAPARKLIGIIGNSGYKLEASHPSPLSFDKGFHGCLHFRKCNEILTSLGKDPIIW